MRANGIPIQTRAQTFLRAQSLKGKEPKFLKCETKSDGSFFFFEDFSFEDFFLKGTHRFPSRSYETLVDRLAPR